MKIKTLAKFSKESALEEIDEFEWTEFIFNLESVDVCNKANNNLTTIELKSGIRQTIAIKWEVFEELMGKDYKTVIDAEVLYEFNEKEN